MIRADEHATDGAPDRNLVLVALMLTMAIAALDGTIVSPAVPAIVRGIGGFSLFPWLFSVYLLTGAVVVPIYGRLADVHGRRPVLFVGIGIFLVGSVLCGAAWSMPTLIAARAVQGLGAGAIVPLTATLVGDLYPIEQRGKAQGWVSSVWGVSSVVGPALGGVFAQYLSWRWIFFCNLPVGLLAIAMLRRHLAEVVERVTHRFDLLGAALLGWAMSLLVLGLLEGGVAWSWGSRTSALIFAAAVLLVGGFIAVEHRAREPILPSWLFSRRVLAASTLAGLALGGVVVGIDAYVPTYAQGVVGVGAVLGGLSVASLSIGWPLADALAARLYLRIDFRATSMCGSGLMIAGCALYATTVHAGTGLGPIVVASFVCGSGLGLVSTATLVAAQSVVGWTRRGVVTGANMFARSMGSAVGVAIFGGIEHATLDARFTHPPTALAGRLPRSVDATTISFASGHLSPDVVRYAKQALDAASHRVFVALAVTAVLSLLAGAWLPRPVEELVFEDSATIESRS